MQANGIGLVANDGRVLNRNSYAVSKRIVKQHVESSSASQYFVDLVQCFIRFSSVLSLLLVVNVAQAQIRFQDTTDAAGGPFHEGETWGAAWGDLDGDIYPDVYSNNHGQRNAIYRNNGDGTFTDVTNNADVDRVWIDDPEGDIHGGSWADFDNDGDQDIFSTRSSGNSHIQLMENNGQGRFEQNSAQYNIKPFGGGRMPLLFDYTNDGYLDVAIARNDPAGLEIFRFNPNTNRYVRTTDEVGIRGECLRNNYGLISDLFNNNKLHYICMPEQRVAERVFDMSTTPWTDVNNRVDSVGVYTDAVLADFNGDLLQDIFALRGRVRPSGASLVSSQRIEAWVAVDSGNAPTKGVTFKANGSISIRVFARDVGEPDGVRIGSSGYRPNRFPATLNPTNSDNWGLVSNNNRRGVAVYVGFNPDTQEWTVELSAAGNDGENSYITVDGQNLRDLETHGLLGSDRASTPGFLINNGSRLNSAGARGIGAVQCGGIAAADFDNDMDIDLYLTCRTGTSNLVNRLYLNNGSGQFSRSNNFGGEGLVGVGIDGLHGTAENVVTADYDVDGFMDLYVTNGNRLFPHTGKDNFSAGGQVRFLRNLGNDNRWLQIDLQGQQSNRDGFGAKVFVTAGGRTQVRENNGMNHRYSHDSRRIHVGLARNTQANVRIEWPDGSVDVHNNVAANRLYRAVQNGALTVRSNGNPSGGGGVSTPPAISQVSINDVVVDESDGSAVLTISLSEPSSSRTEVRFSSISGSATSNSDFVPRSGLIVFSAGQTQVTRTFEIFQDNEVESEESFTVQLSDADGLTITGGVGTVTIRDDDIGGAPPPPAPSAGPVLNIEDLVVDESTQNAVVRITLSEPASSRVRVDFTSASGTAINGQDFTGRAESITFDPGDTVRTRTFTILQDDDVEGSESFTVQLSNADGADIANDIATVTISDDDSSAPTPPLSVDPEISIEDLTVDESARDAVVRITLSEPASTRVRVNYASSSQTATDGQDFTGRAGTIVFNAGDTVRTRIFEILQDNISEPEESFSVRLSNAVGAGLANDTAIVTINDDDGGSPALPPPPASGGPELSIEDLVVNESDLTATVRIALSEPISDSVRVAYESVSGTATDGQDFTGRSGFILFDPGDTLRTRTFTILQDNLAESNESFTVQLSDADGADIALETAIVTIIDDDDSGSSSPLPPTSGSGPSLSIEDLVIDESAGNAVIRVTLSEPVSSQIRVNYASASGTAMAGQDFTGRTGVIDFSPGATVRTRTFAILQDDQPESDESFTVQLSNANGVDILVDTATVTISDDDGGSGAPPSPPSNGGPALSIEDLVVGENDQNAVVRITLSEPASSRVEVRYTSASGTATDGQDFTGRTGLIVFNTGDTQRTRTFEILQDDEAEPNESFTVQLNSADGADIISGIATVTINDDDGGSPPLPSPPSGNDVVCGEPASTSGGNDGNIFLWRDCTGNGRWHVRVMAGPSFMQFVGQLNTSEQFTNVRSISLESNDSLDLSSANSKLSFLSRNPRNASDEFEFDLSLSSAITCFSINEPSGRQVLVGRNSVPVSPRFNIDTLTVSGCN